MTTTLVTGATRGLGFEAARRLAAEGHTVYLGGRDAARGQEAAARAGATAIEMEVTDEDSVAAAVARIKAEAGALDVLVNNAGIAGEQQPPGEASLADLRAVLEVNVIGAASVLSACAPLLEASTAPVVVNVSSGVGSLALNSRPDSKWRMLAYPVSKAALNMLTVQYAGAFPRWRVNSVNPGLTDTGFSPVVPGGHPVEVGADIIVKMAMIGPDGPTGGYVNADGPVPW